MAVQLRTVLCLCQIATAILITIISYNGSFTTYRKIYMHSNLFLVVAGWMVVPIGLRIVRGCLIDLETLELIDFCNFKFQVSKKGLMDLIPQLMNKLVWILILYVIIRNMPFRSKRRWRIPL